MSSSDQNAKDAPKLPRVEQGVIDTYLTTGHDIEKIYQRLQQSNPELAYFIMARAEQLSPCDIQGKAKLLRLALDIYGVQLAQLEVLSIRQTLSPRKENPSD